MKKHMVICLTAMMVMSVLTGCITVVEIGEEGRLTGEVAFNAGDNVAEFWDSLAMPELQDKAVELSQLIEEANGDFYSLADRYGSYSMGDSGELSFTVRATATVSEVNRESAAGYMAVELENGQGGVAVKLQIGTVYKGTSIRDCLSFISFDDYTNQIEWAQVSQNINVIVDEQVVGPVEVDSLTGKTIEFVGCFTVNNPDEVLITPVILSVQ